MMSADVALVISVVLGAAAGAGMLWLALRHRGAGSLIAIEERLRGREAELEHLRTTLSSREEELRGLQGMQVALREEAAAVRQQLASEQKASQEKLDQLVAVDEKLRASFGALSAQALRENNQAFLDLAAERLGSKQKENNAELLARKVEIDHLLKPMQETLSKLESQAKQMETARVEAYTQVLTEIKNVKDTHEGLRRETTQLVQALRAPRVRGNWGEMQLKRCIEFAGMVQHASFDTQVFVRTADSSLKPDCIVHLPNHRCIVIDAKTPFDSFLDSTVAGDEAERGAKLKLHAEKVRRHLGDLSAKRYWQQFATSPDFVVCFLPSEVLFSAALEQDPSLIEYGSASNVILCTPTTLIALLKAVAYGWQQMEITRNALEIRDTASLLYTKLAGMQRAFVSLGNKLKSAADCYDDMLVKVEGRGGVFSQARKLNALGIGEEELKESVPVSLATRSLKAEDWNPGTPKIEDDSGSLFTN